MMTKPPRILVTRSPHQASALADRLRALGAEPILIATIELVEPTTFAPMDIALCQLLIPNFSRATGRQPAFDWLVFTSANAVEVFAQRRLNISRTSLPQATRVASIGAATTRALDDAGFAVDLQPPQAVAESLADALVPFALRPDGQPARFLLVRAEEARDVLPEALVKAGAEVTIVAAYRNVMPAGVQDALRLLLQQGPQMPDAITFTSSSTARNLFSALDAAEITLPAAIALASIGPVTSASLGELGYAPHVEAAEPNVQSLAEAVIVHLNKSEASSNEAGADATSSV